MGNSSSQSKNPGPSGVFSERYNTIRRLLEASLKSAEAPANQGSEYPPQLGDQAESKERFFPATGLVLLDENKAIVDHLIPGDLVTIPVVASGRVNLKHYMVYLGVYQYEPFPSGMHHFLEYNIGDDNKFRVFIRLLFEVQNLMDEGECKKLKLRIDTTLRPNLTPDGWNIQSALLQTLDNTRVYLGVDEPTAGGTVQFEATDIPYKLFDNNCETFARGVSGRGQPQQCRLFKNSLNHMAKIFGTSYDSWKEDTGSKGCTGQNTCIRVDQARGLTRELCSKNKPGCRVTDSEGEDLSTKEWDALVLSSECTFIAGEHPHDL